MSPFVNSRGTPAERLLVRCIPEPNSGCWLWLGALCNPRYGYGSFFLNGRHETAHRASWLIFCGSIPQGMEIDHRCRNPYCVNPEHLRPLSVADNRAPGLRLRDRCRKGHALAGDNLLIEGNGIRRCRRCRALSRR
jgi:hypothetical protein